METHFFTVGDDNPCAFEVLRDVEILAQGELELPNVKVTIFAPEALSLQELNSSAVQVGIFDYNLYYRGSTSTRCGHFAPYAPRALRSVWEVEKKPGTPWSVWPSWVQELGYAVAIGEAAVESDEARYSCALFLIRTFTCGVTTNARKGRTPWGQHFSALRDPAERFKSNAVKWVEARKRRAAKVRC